MRLTLIRLHHLRFKYDNPVNVLTLLVQAPVFTIGLITRLPPTNFKWLITTTILNPKNDNTFVAVAKSQMHFFGLFLPAGENVCVRPNYRVKYEDRYISCGVQTMKIRCVSLHFLFFFPFTFY